MSHYVIFSTVPSLREARSLARHLLSKRLAACINISAPVESHYVWRGKQEKSREYLLIIKTKKSLFAELAAVLQARHSYETPEIIALPIKAGNKSYLDWISTQTL